MPPEVEVKRVEPQPIAAVRRQCAAVKDLAAVIPEGLGVVWAFIRAAAIPHTGINLVLYRDGEINLECGVVVQGPFTADGPVISSATPGGLVATAVHMGPYARLGETHQALHEWCKRESHRLAGPSWEIYDHWNDDPAQLRTDIFYLLEEDGSSDAAA
jgi:effector-binding domain-containing protein